MPTGRLAALAAGGAVAAAALPWRVPLGALAVTALLVVAAGLDAWAAPAPDRIGVQRQVPATVTLGGTEASVTWRVTNPTRRGLRVAIADELAPSLGADRRRAWFRLAPLATASAATTLRPTRRGRFAPSEIVVRVEGPLGLAARQGRRRQPVELRVLPVFPARRDAELRVRQAQLTAGLRTARARGSGTEFEALRDYTADDELRRMDWAATARAGRPIVRTYRAERNQQVVILLDNGRVMAAPVAGAPRVEHGIDAAMALTLVATALGDRCGLVTFDREVRAVVPPRGGPAQLGRVTEALYDLQPRLVESDYLGAFSATVARFRRRALLVLLTELTEEAVAETLLPALPLLLGRHLVVVASVTDPAVLAWASETPADGPAVYRAAAALQAVARRQDTVSYLRSVGATVIDAAPGRLAGALADVYLDLKAAGRL